MTQNEKDINEKGRQYLEEYLASVDAQVADCSDDAEAVDLVRLAFVIRTLIEVLVGPKHPQEHKRVAMAAEFTAALLADLFEDERDSFTGVVDVCNPENSAQQIASLLMHAARVFQQRRREYRYPFVKGLPSVSHVAGAA
jgi:hypothetical protein